MYVPDTFLIDSELDQVMLRFGAVDWHCQVYVNQEMVGQHW